MFERKIEESISRLMSDTLAGRDRITSREIMAAPIPKALRTFFERDIDAWVQEEQTRLLQSPHFSYDDDEVLGLFHAIAGKAREYVVFQPTEYAAALDRNVKLLFNHVCRPQWTLTTFFFADRDTVPTDDITAGLRYFWHYEYYGLIIAEYFAKKGMTTISAKKFSELISHIDQELVRGFDTRKLATLTEPLFELFNIGSDSEEKRVPLEAVSLFFDDKNLTAIVERVDAERPQREHVTMHELVLIIADVDYTMSADIFSIVSQHAQSLGVNVPERPMTAARDFDIPAMDMMDHEPVDIGDESDELNFVISEEEQGVVEQDFDSIDDDAELEGLAEAMTPKPADILVTDEEQEPEALEDFGEETDEAILELEDEIASTYNAPSADDDEEFEEEEVQDEPSDSASDEDDDADQPATPALTEEDFAMLEDIDLSDFDENKPADIIVDDEITLADDVLLDEELTPVAQSQQKDLEIDWEKEAANVTDILIDGIPEPEPTEARSSLADLPKEVELKPAEELLSQLDLDDLPESPAAPAKKHASDEIPLFSIDDDTPASRGRSAAESEARSNEPSVPVEEVVRQFGDLHQIISASDKKKYAKKLFQRSDDAVNQALNVLNGKPTWREASEYIDELYIKYDVDMYSRVAVQFTDDIYKRYLKK